MLSIDAVFQVIVKDIMFKARVKVLNFGKKDSITRHALSWNLKNGVWDVLRLMAFCSFGNFKKFFESLIITNVQAFLVNNAESISQNVA